jgi:ABC-type amino acid transport substrate-binding protein
MVTKYIKKINIRTIIIDLVILLLGGYLIYVLRFSNGVRDLNTIRAKKVLRVAIRVNQFDYMSRGDTLAGFQYDLVNFFCDSILNVKPEFIRVRSLQDAINDLLDGKVDLIAQNIPLTSETKQLVSISFPILISRAVLVQRKEADGQCLIKNQLQLGKQQITLEQGSYYIQLIRYLAHELNDTIYINQMNVYDSEELILLVAKGTIPYAVTDERVAQYFAKRFTGIDVSLPVGFSQLQGWVVNPQTPKFNQLLNNWLRHFVKTNKFHQLYGKYYY